jgi:hypothetical protein
MKSFKYIFRLTGIEEFVVFEDFFNVVQIIENIDIKSF